MGEPDDVVATMTWLVDGLSAGESAPGSLPEHEPTNSALRATARIHLEFTVSFWSADTFCCVHTPTRRLKT